MYQSIKALLVSALLSSSAAAHDHPPGMTHLVFANGAVHAHAIWTKGPHSPDESILRIEWKNGADHSAMEPPGALKVSPYMPAMGHGSAPTRIDRVLDSRGQVLVGVFQVSSIYFTMNGDWDVRVTLKYADGSQETKVIKVHLDDTDDGHDH
jgi:hypothetical protein